MQWMLKPLAWLFAWRPTWRDAFGTLVLYLRGSFFAILFAVFVAAGTVDQFFHPFTTGLSNASFDWLMRHRPISVNPDPTIMVLDIDEASLTDLNPQYGRWPWPREVLAQVAGRMEAAGARVVMFDVMFADRDVANPKSEEAFDRYVRSSSRSFYPFVRLNPQNDGASEIKVAALNFAERDPSSPADPARTIALIPPYFKSIYDTTRLGTNNIEPDADNVIRKYPNYEVLAGYRIPSLPYRIGRELRWPRPQQAKSLINWPRAPSGYATVPFVQAFRALQQSDAGYYARFAGKTVLIGSTAVDLNDIKATPVDSALPGIYVLATVLDNMKHEAFLHPLPHWFIWSVEMLLLAAAALLFSRTALVDRVAPQLLLLPTVLLVLALLSVSVSTLLFDLSVPLAAVLTYFAIGQLFRKAENDFIAGAESFAYTARELPGRSLEVATLPESHTRDEVIHLIRAQLGVKLWEPMPRGLGQPWVTQGWVLWRWSKDDAPGSGSPGPQLRWVRVAADPSNPSRPALAQAIARAFEDIAHSLVQPAPEPSDAK
jgi:adenylate cyclase